MLDHTDVFSAPDEGKGGVVAFVKIAHKSVSPASRPIYRGSNDTIHLPPAADAGSALGTIHPPGPKRTLDGVTVYPYAHALDVAAAPLEGSAADDSGGGGRRDNGAASASPPQKQVVAPEVSTSTNALNLQSPHHKPNIHQPSGWMCVGSKSQKRWYFFDTKTNKSVW